jgi:hypothetical protein
MSVQLRDLKWGLRGATVKPTGMFLPYRNGLIKDFSIWTPYFLAETALAVIRHGFRPAKFTVTFTPDTSPSWYLIRSVILRGGGRIVSPGAPADLSVHFEDKTTHGKPARPNAKVHLNYGCTDISKTRVAETFAGVFGYELAVNPATFTGKMVCKSELNGTHDGHITTGPCTPKPGWVYQRVINNETDRGTVRDFRCVTLFGKILLVYIKERPQLARFANSNSSCELSTASDHFSPEELAKVSQFCQKMGLDWGGLDILRDTETDQIYIVDVNKTDMGPPLALSMKDKLASTHILSRALADAINKAAKKAAA